MVWRKNQLILVLKKKQIIIATICILSSILVPVAYGVISQKITYTSVSTPIYSNWGLTFSKDNTPKGNASSDYLKQYNCYYVGKENEKKIYLTFDAGYENGYTSKILDILKKNGVQATFFLVGNYIETRPDLVKRMVNENHLVGNHTLNHPDMSKMQTVEEFKKEVLPLEDLFKNVTGKDMLKIYRPPQGKYSEENLRIAKELGYTTFFWSLAYVDWIKTKQPSKEVAFKKLSKIHPGAIVLLHSTSKTNSEILDDLIKKYKSEGYIFSSLTDFICSK